MLKEYYKKANSINTEGFVKKKSLFQESFQKFSLTEHVRFMTFARKS